MIGTPVSQRVLYRRWGVSLVKLTFGIEVSKLSEQVKRAEGIH